ncbi:collagen alpha-1(XII) chain [Lingula anatina]|uniref:Collagen alpha-1(XII) chain n=1 Tax=Lingula anatina TaxID=7574 RepID=A0A1S3KAS9_LINAN|nr:collagen alpha-1(XII) chain [Lingula anatina]|eukprot:XP_013419748.1 collagen alpha-1(XII) chain [Lingula anatina]
MDMGTLRMLFLLCILQSFATNMVDIVFLVDISGSMGKNGSKTVIKFMMKMVNTSFNNISQDGVRVGIILFSDSEKDELFLESGISKGNVLHFTKNFHTHCCGTETNTHLGFKRVREYFNHSHPHGGRECVPKIAVVIMAGVSANPSETRKEVIKTRDQSIEIFVLGIGNSTNKTELEFMASDPDDSHLYTVDSFQKLKNIDSRSIGEHIIETGVNAPPLCPKRSSSISPISASASSVPESTEGTNREGTSTKGTNTDRRSAEGANTKTSSAEGHTGVIFGGVLGACGCVGLLVTGVLVAIRVYNSKKKRITPYGQTEPEVSQ